MASRAMNKLSDRAVRAAKEPGWYGDGAGLYLRVDAVGGRRWVFVFQWQGKRAEMGLGALADVSLAEARDARTWAREEVKGGRNPIDERRRQREAAEAEANKEPPKTFSVWAEEIADVVGPKAAKARKAWLKRMQVSAGAMAAKALPEIGTEDVLAALKPFWVSRPETGRKMRMAIEAVLDAAKAKGLIEDPWQNPARWRGHLAHLLEKRSTPVKHRTSLPYAEVASFFADLRKVDRMSALALEFTILTAVRTKEALGARWDEIDRKARTWTIPAERMKGEAGKKREHVVPLTDAAIDVLDRASTLRVRGPRALIFPSTFRFGPLSEGAMQLVLNEMGMKGRATVHGFRSTFKDWAGDCTNFPDELSEAALAHVVGDETRRAYRRTDAFLKRRRLMEAWAGYLTRPASAKVIPLGRSA